MAAIAGTGKGRHHATEITGEFGEWYQNPKQALPKCFTQRLLPHFKVTILQINSKGESFTSSTDTAHKGANAVKDLFERLHDNGMNLEFNPESDYTHVPKSPHTHAILNITGDNSTHTVQIQFKATCDVKMPRAITEVAIQITTGKK